MTLNRSNEGLAKTQSLTLKMKILNFKTRCLKYSKMNNGWLDAIVGIPGTKETDLDL